MPRLTLLAGPAGSGKTERLLRRYRSALRTLPIGSVLWLIPTARAGRELRGRLLNAELPACLRPGINTFSQFADAILEHAGANIRPISDWQKRELLESLVDRTVGKKRLKHFGPIADTDGFLDQLTSFISELKRLEIWPDDFYTACERRGASNKDRDLLLLYSAYQKLLVDHQLFDFEGRFWEARELLKNGLRPPFDKLQLVVVDGFTDFTRTQHEMLELLTKQVDEIHVGLPLERESPRDELFAKTQATLTELQRRHPRAAVEWLDRPQPPSWPALDHLERRIFGDPRNVMPVADPAGVEILAAARQDGEIELIGRRIKRLLLQAVRPQEIVVVFRNLAEITPLVRQAFARLGIPFVVEGTQLLREAPALRTLAALVRLAVGDWPFRPVLALLGNSLLHWPDPPERRDHAVAAAQLAVRQLQIHKGMQPLLERVEQLASPARKILRTPDKESRPLLDWIENMTPLESQREENDESRRFSAALSSLHQLRDWLKDLPSQATLAEWETALRQLANTTGLSQEDSAAWDTFWSAFAESEELSQLLREAPRSWDREQVLEQIEQLRKHTTLPRDSDETGCIRVLSAQSVRALRVPYLFLAGLAEKAFPPTERDDRLYGDAEYQSLNEHGLNLIDRTQRSQEEMLLFYEVLTRATRRLFLSYPALDEKAQPLSPSPYLNEVERACGSGRIARTSDEDLTPTAHATDLYSAEDWRLLAVKHSLHGQEEQSPTAPHLLAGLAVGLASTPATQAASANLYAGLRLVQARATRDSFGPFEGLLTSTAVRQKLIDRFGPQHCWSASQLEQYAHCPHQFYLHRVLNLRPLPDLSLELDFLARGGLLHEVLATLHRKLNADRGAPVAAGMLSTDILSRLFAETVDLCAAQLGADGPLRRALVEIDRRTVLEWGPNYVEQAQRYDAPPDSTDKKAPAYKPVLAAAHFEVAFGPDKGVASPDPLSTERPFELRHDGEVVKLAGRIDRIDVGQVGRETVFSVIDYKSGRPTGLKREDIEAGTVLQLPLYALVVQEMLLLARQATPWQIGYWFITEKGFVADRAIPAQTFDGQTLRPEPAWEELKLKLCNRVVAIVRGIRSAEFPVYSSDEQCTSRCDFRTVCRIHQIRALNKTWPPLSPNRQN